MIAGMTHRQLGPTGPADLASTQPSTPSQPHPGTELPPGATRRQPRSRPARPASVAHRATPASGEGTPSRTAALISELHPDESPQSWRSEALCTQADPEAFFPEKGQTGYAAKRICEECPVRPECLDFAMSVDDLHGIWGGLSDRQRYREKKRRQGSVAA